MNLCFYSQGLLTWCFRGVEYAEQNSLSQKSTGVAVKKTEWPTIPSKKGRAKRLHFLFLTFHPLGLFTHPAETPAPLSQNPPTTAAHKTTKARITTPSRTTPTARHTGVCHAMPCHASLAAPRTCECLQQGRQYSSKGRLLDEGHPPQVFECNLNCSCHQDECRNRLVQRGMTCSIKVGLRVIPRDSVRESEGAVAVFVVCTTAVSCICRVLRACV